MIFRPELAWKIATGEKNVTRRVCSSNPRSPWWREHCALEIGRDYAVQVGRAGKTICRVVVVAVNREPLGVLTDAEARLEGFKDAPSFTSVFEEINGFYDASVDVWRVAFLPPKFANGDAA